MIGNKIRLSHFANPKANRERPYPRALERVLSIAEGHAACESISAWPGYAVTDLHVLDGIADQLGIARLWYKDEAKRFGLGSFKALGGAYAVFVQLRKIVEERTGETVSYQDLIDKRHAKLLSGVVVTSATDGNHGRSVAWGAQLFGCQCVIYVHANVSVNRQNAIEALGAEVVRIDGNYADAVKQTAADARKFDRIVVSDTGYEGYMEIPRTVTLGYTMLLKEIVEQLQGDVPTHVFLQGGVGGLASAACSYFWQLWGRERPRLIIVEPEAANCLQQSARHGAPVAVKGDLKTLMGGLECGEVSLLAWQILSEGCDDFMTLDENSVGPCMRMLANGEFGDPEIIAGESAVAGLAAAIGSAQSKDLAGELGLDIDSRILVIGTEGATDPDLYHALVRPQKKAEDVHTGHSQVNGVAARAT